jgi:hypothetical protein
MGTLMPTKKREHAPTPASENKDSPYSQRFQKERGTRLEFIKT